VKAATSLIEGRDRLIAPLRSGWRKALSLIAPYGDRLVGRWAQSEHLIF
jgi:hypothetical protein